MLSFLTNLNVITKSEGVLLLELLLTLALSGLVLAPRGFGG
jgi:hypothetical protein